MTTTKRIIRNAIQCRQCWDIVESFTSWDHVSCTCGSVAVEGGHNCLRRFFKNSAQESFIELSECE